MGENKKNQKGVIRIEQVSWRQPLCGDLSSAAAGSGRGGRHSKFQRSTVKTQTVRILQHISLPILYPLYTGDNIIFKQNKDLNPILYIWYMVFKVGSPFFCLVNVMIVLRSISFSIYYLTNVSLQKKTKYFLFVHLKRKRHPTSATTVNF